MKKIKVTENGPYQVSGSIPLKKVALQIVDNQQAYVSMGTIATEETYNLCRCGKTKTPPFCDGSHVHSHFDGTETANNDSYEDRSEEEPGPVLNLLDDNRCAYARFCHRRTGSVWELVGQDDPELVKEAELAACNCPTGRLTVYNHQGQAIEPDYPPEILIAQDDSEECSAGIFVRGSIPLESANGELYETRNRYALCRCGYSENKPFCDAMHVSINFQAGE